MSARRLLSARRYRGRRAVTIEGRDLRVTVLEEGGHIAEIFDKAAGVNPLWTPPWVSIEPSEYGRAHAATYGDGIDATLLAGIMGHNLCLDLFGPPSEADARTGLTAHGESSVARYDLDANGQSLVARAHFPIAGLRFERRLEILDRVVAIRERVENVSGSDRSIGWTEHVTLGPPFLEPGTTEFRASATRSRVFESTFGADDYLRPAADFDWPHGPMENGQPIDLRVFRAAERSSAFTTHLMDQHQRAAYFVAFAPAFELAFGYVWKPDDFPWLGIWEENRSRTQPPWQGKTVTRGMEFGVSPFPETREEMVERGRLFGVPCYRRIAAGQTMSVEYYAVVRRTRSIPESLDWPA
jgi:hypothetical protein